MTLSVAPAVVAAPSSSGAINTSTPVVRRRMVAIDALRGFIMLCMIVDHVRETFFLHHQVTDPMNVLSVSPELFLTRMVSEICAPVFILLAGLSAWLYGQSKTKPEVTTFLLKRGFFLVILELTIVNFGWTAKIPPDTLWLQVIWCIGLCMMALAFLIYLPPMAQLILAITIIGGHNLLDSVNLPENSILFPFWAILHQKAYLPALGSMHIHVTYPVLPWIGVILTGYVIGPFFGRNANADMRRKFLIKTGLALLVAFFVIRYLNVYGEKPWVHTGNTIRTIMSFFSATKYPPSLMFLLPTLGGGLLLLAFFEKIENSRFSEVLAVMGGAPMFFYLAHIYILKILYLVAFAVFGPVQGTVFGFNSLWAVWAFVPVLAFSLYFPTSWFARLKQRRRDITLLKYF